MLSSPYIERLDHRSVGFYEACSAFTHVATRQLAHQPKADFVSRLQHVDCSSYCYSCLAAPGSYRRGTCLIFSETHPMDHDSISSGHTNKARPGPNPFRSPLGLSAYEPSRPGTFVPVDPLPRIVNARHFFVYFEL